MGNPRQHDPNLPRQSHSPNMAAKGPVENGCTVAPLAEPQRPPSDDAAAADTTSTATEHSATRQLSAPSTVPQGSRHRQQASSNMAAAAMRSTSEPLSSATRLSSQPQRRLKTPPIASDEALHRLTGRSRQAKPAREEGRRKRPTPPVWACPGTGRAHNSAPSQNNSAPSQNNPASSQNNSVSTSTRYSAHKTTNPENTKSEDTDPPHPTTLSCALINAWSLPKHALEINDYITSKNLDILAITETWLTDSSGPAISLALPQGYTIKTTNRTQSKGGGVAIIHKEDIALTPASSDPCTDCESLLLKLVHNSNFCINFLLIYRPPNNMPNFNIELTQILSPLNKTNTATILLGDLNRGLGDPEDRLATDLKASLNEIGLTTANADPTHNKGRVLDWIAHSNIQISNLLTSPCIWSDHSFIEFTVNLPSKKQRQHAPTKSTTARNLKALTPTVLRNTLDTIMAASSDADHPNHLVDIYHKHISETLDNVAPKKQKKSSRATKSQSWFSDPLRAILAEKRKAEITWAKSHLEEDKITWRSIANRYKAAVQKAKAEHYEQRITSADNQSKELFNVLRELEKPLGDATSFIPTAESCANTQTFFATKVKTARDKITKTSDNTTAPQGPPPPTNPTGNTHNSTPFNFTPVTTEQTLEAIKQMRPSSDRGDICPSKLVIQNAELFAPFFTRVINASFKHSTVPKQIKEVWVTPLPKKPNADLSDPANLRPITNVMFLLKIIDKIATRQFQQHLESHNLLHPRQSGFRRGHSTESALLDLKTRMLDILDRGKAGLLVLLDLSAAFDLIDHNILIDRLTKDLNCSPECGNWTRSFLTDRQSKVCWEEAESKPETLVYGVPQGSCLSPALFNAYLLPLFSKLDTLGVTFTNYADDTQLLLELTGNHATDTHNLNRTYRTIKTWMDKHWMCLNGNKTELMLLASNTTKKKLGPEYESFNLENSTIQVKNTTKTLGAHLDSTLSMTPHVSNLVRSSHYYLRLLRQIRPFLSEKNSTTLTRAVILPRLDYCNVLLTKTSQANIAKLQVIQNEAVRIVGQIPRRDHISTKRRQLHWLPVENRIRFKLLTTAFKCSHGKAPSYLTESIKPLPQPRTLRSNNSGLLSCPRFKKESGNGRSFCTAAPREWNNLPTSLRTDTNLESFKKKLKTHLFN